MPPGNEHGRSPDQESDVPEDPLRARHRFVDVVDAQDLVVDEALNDIEQPEADQHRGRQQPP